MAKGLRASSKVKARNARRYTTGTDYQVTHAARLNAISQRLMSQIGGKDEDKEGSKDGLNSMDADEEKDVTALNEDNDEETEKNADSMQTSENNNSTDGPKKISTSGPRNNRREQWRKARGWSVKKKGSKNGGRAKRRK